MPVNPMFQDFCLVACRGQEVPGFVLLFRVTLIAKFGARKKHFFYISLARTFGGEWGEGGLPSSSVEHGSFLITFCIHISNNFPVIVVAGH